MRHRDPPTYERREPVRRADVGADVVTPMLQAMALGIAALVLVWILAGAGAGLRAGAVTFALSLAVLILHSRTLLTVTERRYGDELADAEPPPAATPRVRAQPVILHAKGEIIDLEPIAPTLTTTLDARDPDRRLALDLAEFVAMGQHRGYSRRDWTGANQTRLSTGTLTTQGTWSAWVGWLKAAGLLTVDSAGTRLTCDVDEVLRCILHPANTVQR